MIRVLGLDHIVIRVRDPQASIGFYRDVLGCAVERELPELGLIQLRAGSALIDLVDLSKPLGQSGGAGPEKGGRNMDHFALRIADLDPDRLKAHLMSHGVEPGEVQVRYGAEGNGPSMYIQDPDGNVVELKGPPEAKVS